MLINSQIAIVGYFIKLIFWSSSVSLKLLKLKHSCGRTDFTLEFNSSFLTKKALLPLELVPTKLYPLDNPNLYRAFSDAP